MRIPCTLLAAGVLTSMPAVAINFLVTNPVTRGWFPAQAILMQTMPPADRSIWHSRIGVTHCMTSSYRSATR